MKRTYILAFLVLFTSSLQAQWINHTESKSFNFIAPTGATALKNQVLFPFYEVNTYSVTTNDTIKLTVTQFFTIYTTADTLHGTSTKLLLTINSQLTPGARLFVMCKSGTIARNIIPSTGIVVTAITGTSTKTKYLEFVYNGTAFVHIATNQVN